MRIRGVHSKQMAFQTTSKNWGLVQRLLRWGETTCRVKGVGFMYWLGLFFSGKSGRVINLGARKMQGARAIK